MKRTSLLWSAVAFLGLAALPLAAQDRGQWRAGFFVNQLQNDFGLGLELQVPLVGNEVSLQLAVTNQWRERFAVDQTQAIAYQSIRLGSTGGWLVGDHLRLYGAGGIMAILPGEELSSETLTLGGYGNFGFEFFVEKRGGSALFIEIGGGGAGGRADRLVGQPLLGSGMLLQSGFRVGF